jgi:hypothetical protein
LFLVENGDVGPRCVAASPPSFAVQLHGERFVYGDALADIVHVAKRLQTLSIANGRALFVALPRPSEISFLVGSMGNPKKSVGVQHFS